MSCLCPPCITESGICLNESHTNPWKLVNLIPQKGANLRKYQKRPNVEIDRKNTGEEENEICDQLQEHANLDCDACCVLCVNNEVTTV